MWPERNLAFLDGFKTACWRNPNVNPITTEEATIEQHQTQEAINGGRGGE